MLNWNDSDINLTVLWGNFMVVITYQLKTAVRRNVYVSLYKNDVLYSNFYKRIMAKCVKSWPFILSIVRWTK